jgi:hypothetical protein
MILPNGFRNLIGLPVEFAGLTWLDWADATKKSDLLPRKTQKSPFPYSLNAPKPVASAAWS